VRRAIIALVGTAAGTVLLVGAKSGFGHSADAGTLPLAGNQRSSANPGGSGPPAGAVPPGRPGATTGPTPGTAKTTAPGSTTTTAPGPKTTTKAPAGNGGMRDGTWNGTSEANDYGNVELSIVVSGGKITNVNVLDYPQAQSRSVQISQSALPKLKQEALKAQSANINTVSGASETSESYRQSLQAAIDRSRG
jgi:uncharacterized protein with FMN-binding domain